MCVDLDARAFRRSREFPADRSAGRHRTPGAGRRRCARRGRRRTTVRCGRRRVVLGSVAVREPARVEDWLTRYGAERICIALDTREARTVSGACRAKAGRRREAPTLEALAPRYARRRRAHRALHRHPSRRHAGRAQPRRCMQHLRELRPEAARTGVRRCARSPTSRAVRELGLRRCRARTQPARRSLRISPRRPGMLSAPT